uniref:Lipase domain-containing protein n=1 Tax=Tetranychus urticae TaxID=32264 RepID=T1JRK9_TETUR
MNKFILISFLIIFNCGFAVSHINNETVKTIFEIIAPYFRIDRLQVFKGPKCFSDLGCFENRQTFQHPIFRPISLSPEEPEKIETRFFLYSKPGQIVPQLINHNNITRSNFNPKLRTIFAVHGFYYANYLGQYQIESFRKLKKALFIKENINYIFVDWGKGASTWYVQATANTRVVGAQLAQLVEKIILNFGVSKNKIWLIGHSLGAHVVGYAGSIVKNIGRITGLDPAKPYFVGMPNEVRLDAGDALFVDVIHTNAPQISQPFGFGTRQILGHVDFYPNGGNNQPGCIKEEIAGFFESLQYGLQKTSICNHERSIQMLASAIDVSNCEMIAHKCDSFLDFKQGSCYLCGPDGQNCEIINNPRPGHQQNQRYFLLTNSEPPFCVHHYRISIHLGDLPASIKQMVIFHLNLTSSGAKAFGHSEKISLKSHASSAFLITGDRLIEDQNLMLELFIESEFHPGTINISHLEITPIQI